MIDYTQIDYDQLALSMIKMQEMVDNATFEKFKTPIGKISKETLDEFNKISDEKVGLEAVLRDVIQMKANIEYRLSAAWDHIAKEVGFDRGEYEGNISIDLKTGELHNVSTPYDKILNQFKSSDLVEKIKQNGGF